MEKRFRLATLTTFMTLTFVSFSVDAKPTGPGSFCTAYPDAPVCVGQVVACTLCHTSVPEWNTFGVDVATNLTDTFEVSLVASLAAIEGDDSDGDGISNLEEIMLGTSPGDPNDFYIAPQTPVGSPNPSYDVGNYDAKVAYRRMKVGFCGTSPTYAEMTAFDAAGDKSAFIDAALDACLESSYWKDEALHRLADAKIRPLEAVGTGDGAVIPLADYEWDYRLFSHVLTGGRDARELLTAQYHIDENGQVVNGAIIDGDFGQPLLPQYRAGMITSQWFIMIHTMFSEIPRTTAAQAYRAYLGQDIARSEGLLPVAGEPLDVDDKDIDYPACAHCHSTLDPLSYAFAYYEGISGGDTGTFDSNRPGFDANTVQASLLGVPLTNIQTTGVVGWGALAANSIPFRRALVEMFMIHAVGTTTPYEEGDIQALMDSMQGDGFSANALIHRLVDTDAFGVP